MEEKKEKPTIGMLLDIEHLYGEHESRMGPVLGTLCISAAPILFYVYFGLFNYIPIWLFIPIEIFIIIRAVMLILGRERYRVGIFKRQLFDSYTSTASLMNIKTIHPDGCVEYLNGQIMYMVCCFNGTTEDSLRRSVQLRKFLNTLLGDFIFDCYILNVTDFPALHDYYKKVKEFDRNESASNFVDIIDYNIDLVQNNSMVQCTVYVVKGRRSDWKDIKNQIDVAINSRTARVYKNVYRVSDPVVINELLNRDVDSIVNIEDLLRKKYRTGNYNTSKVLAYDLPDDKIIEQGRRAAKPVIKPSKPTGFHVAYKEKE